MKENFSKRIQAIIKISKEEAIRLGHSYVGSEHLLLGLITPIKGNIFYNGKSVFKNLNTWRKDVGYISQDIFLLDSTIRENITFNQNKENEKEAFLYQCIEASKLKDKIETLPNKIDTNVGVHGLELSGGERQRIAIARTLYKNPKIIFTESLLVHWI